ncbi:ribosome biogenesis GTPase Der [Sandaracinobacteroides saxicola]|uniref:GTPase Der n=1 Tax=Sandaracinobacteroides saxicola TaxID=2759707 RepID=A0A7G5IKP7_9SPHN|nr:ribosome biogenesis GTPase Der [Sandaracinobacteroides saxicola]QMW23939.1 ribosome biogenesis GTPase Der [Sandaracinobacteroides saxicola]
MSPLPAVVILGRPNVGKSTLFNRLIGKRLALVDDQPGVTRDRREGEAQLFDLKFRIVDTAGLEEAEAESLSGRMRAQTEAALEGAAAALFVVDARAGLTEGDRHFARWLRQQGRVPIVLVANKAEGVVGTEGAMEAYALGLGDPVLFSAEHGEGLADLFEALQPILDPLQPDEVQEDDGEDEETKAQRAEAAPLQLAIVGRPNAGKSTLINRLLSEERLVTGPEAGITRDSIAIDWAWQGRPVKLIDTAGMRRNARVQDRLEKMSVADTRRAIDFAEVVVILLDATLGLEAQDLRIADQVLQEGRALIVALNKWDVAVDQSKLFNGVKAALEDGLSQVKGVPLLTVSGATGKGLDMLMKVAFETRSAWTRRVPTAALNRWFEAALERNPPPAAGGVRIKMRYITQARSRPPTFIIFGNRLDDLPDSYVRYLVNSMREDLGLGGLPIRLNLRSRKNPFD